MNRFLIVVFLVSSILSGCGPLGTPLTPLGRYPETTQAKEPCPKGEPCSEDGQKKTTQNSKGELPPHSR